MSIMNRGIPMQNDTDEETETAHDDQTEREAKLLFKPKCTWLGFDEEDEERCFDYATGYRSFLDSAKTEREAVRVILDEAGAAGFQPLEEHEALGAGARTYAVNRFKSVALVVLGREPLERGCNIVCAHIDAPRLDLKPNPLYEDKSAHLALLRTHYYGGVRKYQWVNHPLALHGTVILGDGTAVDIHIGDAEEDPVFTICDLLPHLSKKKQDKRKLQEGIKGEELTVLVGSRPVTEKKVKKKVKLWVLDYLNREYDMIEEDFISAEFEMVPAERARDIGFDRSMVGGYGQDDRSCAYAALRALLGLEAAPDRTAIALFVDKEEIGSEGATGMKSRFLENTLAELFARIDAQSTDLQLRRALSASKALSADVSAALNPNFKDVHEETNAAKLGYGVVVQKYTGARGKVSASEASVEYVGAIRRLLNREEVAWQAAELGKVDEGGGGTVAKFLAAYNMDVLDIGPPVLSMHSPYEITSKADCYSTYRACCAFFTAFGAGDDDADENDG